MYNNELLRILINGANSADRYISEDLEAICDETMREYADSALDELRKGLEAGKELTTIMQNNKLFLDVLTDISMHVTHQHIKFDDAKVRNATLQSWAQDFVQKHADKDWQLVDYTNLVGEFVVEMTNQYRQLHPQVETEKPFIVSFAFGTGAVREYAKAVDSGKKWSVSSLCNCGSVTHASFATQKELNAYKQGVEDATGWLESERIMTDEEWEEYLNEYFRENEDDDEED